MARSFDFLAADDSPAGSSNDWRVQAAHSRRDADSPERLTGLRTDFLRRHALENANNRGQGRGRILPASAPLDLLKLVDGARRPAEAVLPCLPRYSARLLLKFRLRTPLLTRDDDPFHLFDNPVRKDHLLGAPYLAAASVKGLAADAYQRAFPSREPWQSLGADNHERAHAFRLADPAALRLFGLADDGADTGKDNCSRIGRLHCSPVWFEGIEYLVMNPGNPEQAIGTLPIQFEAIARGQTATLELVYVNPYGTGRDDDERSVRTDLARLLAALGHWWPALGIGAKRLAGYGAIEITGVELQTLGWEQLLPGLTVIGANADTGAPTTAAPAEVEPEPPNYALFVQAGALLDADAEAARKRINRLVQDEIDRAEAALKAATGNDKAPARKKLESLKKNQDARRAELKKHHTRAVEYFEAHAATQTDTDDTESVSSVAKPAFEPAPVYPWASLQLDGAGAWLVLANRLADLPEEPR